MHTIRLLSTLLKINLQMAFAYRLDTAINVLMQVVGLGWELFSLSIIFSNTNTLAGWSFGELITLLGVFHLINAWMMILVWPSTEKFNSSVRDGTLDYTLLLPTNSMFLVTFSRMIIWRAWDFVLGIILIVWGINMSGGQTTSAEIASFILLASSGVLILYSLWVVMISATFWFVRFDNNTTILQALLDTGRYPSGVYPFWLRMIVTFVVPVAVATTIPLQALRGELVPGQVLLYLGVSALSFFVASKVWVAGVRKYSGASS